MSFLAIPLLFLALVGADQAHVRPNRINICVPTGNNHSHSTLFVPTSELKQYPVYVKGACRRVCATVCQNYASRHVNATTNQCTCLGTPLECGMHAKPNNDKTRCKCRVGYEYKGGNSSLSTCVDVNECQSSKPVCSANQSCVNTEGSFVCEDAPRCGMNAEWINDACQCKSGYQGNDPTVECIDINECESLNGTTTAAASICPPNSGCINMDGSFLCQPKPPRSLDHS